MDRRTVKSLIVELKEDNKSFQEVSDILAREYGIKMSRQAVYGMYKRTTSEEHIQNNMNIALATTDILNYSVLGLDATTIKDIISNRNIKLSVAKIKSIIQDNLDYRNKIYTELLKKIAIMISSGNDIDSIRLYLRYKGIEPSDSVINSLINDATIQEIKRKTTEILANIINITDDKSIIKTINTKFNMDITLKDVSKEINK